MDNRTNTIAGWVLAGCGAALGLSIVGGMMFHDDRPEKMGYPIEGVEEAGGEGGAAEVPIATLLATADPAKGADVFKKCAACHTIAQGAPNGIGPNLYATLGEGIAQGKAGFAFSDALKSKGGKWDFDTMSAWLTSPRKFAPGTKMTFAGIGNGQDRANVIAYLNSMGSNLPLPTAPAATNGAPAVPAGGNEGKASGDADPGGKAEPSTDDLSNKATPATGAPSIDPAAKVRGSK
ncbi:c-type cytochrome [Sphingomonas endolithica]|uniref:c-type cytochrome n=1 Tax=Sphingomonas endolithica TaxID=2972485 RepID=UPI0021B05C9C|nr:cytochrome c family protein [Sphingomonas sp. ZFBP2030]